MPGHRRVPRPGHPAAGARRPPPWRCPLETERGAPLPDLPRPRPGRLLTALLLPLALLAVLLEATVWRWLTLLGQALSRLAVFAWLERLVDRLSPGAVLTVFVLPFVPVVPLLKVTELWLLTHHHYVWAVALAIGGKVLGAAFSTRVFAIAKPKLLQVRWFARAYGWVLAMLEVGHRLLDSLPGWQAARAGARRLQERIRLAWRHLRAQAVLAWRSWQAGTPGPVSRHWSAARRWARRRSG